MNKLVTAGIALQVVAEGCRSLRWAGDRIVSIVAVVVAVVDHSELVDRDPPGLTWRLMFGEYRCEINRDGVGNVDGLWLALDDTAYSTDQLKADCGLHHHCTHV